MKRLCVWLLALALAGCYAELDWREFTSIDGRYSVTLPAKPREESRTLNSSAGAVTMHMASARAADWLFGVGYADYPPATAQLADKLIDEQRDSLLRNIKGRVVSDKAAPLDGRPGRVIVAEGRDRETAIALHARFVLDGNRLYQVAAVGAKDRVSEAEVETFLTSFQLRKH